MIRGSAIHIAYRILAAFFIDMGAKRRPTRQRDENRNRALLAIRVLSRTRRAQSQDTRGCKQNTYNFARGLWSEPNGSCRKLLGKCTREPSRTKRTVIADQIHQDRPTPRLSSTQKLREPLRLPPHSFTSVSGSYLALRGVYLALWAALPSNPTLGKSRRKRTAALRAYHPLWAVATVKLDFDWPSSSR